MRRRSAPWSLGWHREHGTRKDPQLSSSFTVEAGYARGVYTLGVVGELDQATVPDLRARIGEAIGTGDGSILIDLSRCDFIDSTGISLLVEAQRKIDGLERRRLVVCCPGAEVRRLLDLTGVGTLLGVFAGRDEALDEVAAA
ncbi:STAS domain-containing protein [Thermoleophilia bacterium SCSIO 60948]|nr:STAS domain-containing protein [Thermoleophilia bacterium SCSIO 60948]